MGVKIMKALTLDHSKSKVFVKNHEIMSMKSIVEQGRSELLSGTGVGNDFLGWIDLPENYDKEEFERVEKAATKIRQDSQALVVIGIGGSYLGSKAAIDFLKQNEDKNSPEIYFVGNNISASYMKGVIRAISNVDFSINVISKSGTTTEPAIAFRIFKKLLIEKYGEEEARRRIYATTDKARGALKTLALEEGYESFVIPDDVGGRFSVLTPVGLLPIAVAGGNIKEMMAGAQAMRQSVINDDFDNNGCLQYVAFRNLFLRKGKMIEIMVNYEPTLHFIGEWWKQLFGESEGKDQKGIFPASMDFTTDLHSLGQFVQDGARILFETVMWIDKPNVQMVLEAEDNDLDGLNYLAGMDLDEVNKNAMMGTMLAHTDGGTPNLLLNIPEQNEFYLGQLFYFFEFACGVSAYVLGVNPFDQPGVEAYKKNMFALLGKAGYEEAGEALKKRLV